MTKNPIFIHSMFRAGSTYLFQAFRRVAGSSYWCYQEPLHELFGDFKENTATYVELTSSQNHLLRHPLLNGSYIAEYIPLAEEISTAYRQYFPYANYFNANESAEKELHQYLTMLSEEAPARPVIQCCRTTARLPSLGHRFNATHIFLWRNPWDQWWSFKVVPYFDTVNLLILCMPSTPPLFSELRAHLALEIIPDDVPANIALAQCGEKLLSSANSYRIFYALWLFAMQRGFSHTHIQISIDALSTLESYRQNVLEHLHTYDIHDIDFSDCHIHRGIYTSKDEAFFLPLEKEIQALFASHQEDVSVLQHPDVIKHHAGICNKSLPEISRWGAACEDIGRMRELVIESESFRNQAQHKIIAMRQEVDSLRHTNLKTTAELESIYHSVGWRIVSPLLKTYWNVRSIWRHYRSAKQPPKPSS